MVSVELAVAKSIWAEVTSVPSCCLCANVLLSLLTDLHNLFCKSMKNSTVID